MEGEGEEERERGKGVMWDGLLEVGGWKDRGREGGAKGCSELSPSSGRHSELFSVWSRLESLVCTSRDGLFSFHLDCASKKQRRKKVS